MKVRHRILFSYCFILALGMAISLQINNSGKQVKDDTMRLVEKEIPQLININALKNNIIEQERILYEYYATTERQQMLFRLALERQKINELLAFLEHSYADSNPLKTVQRHYDRFTEHANALDTVLSSSNIDWDRSREILENLSDEGRNIGPALDKLVEGIEKMSEMTGNNTQSNLDLTLSLVVSFSIIILIIAALVAYYVNRYIAESAERRRLAMFAERNPEPIIVTNTLGQIEYINPACEKYSVSEAGQKDGYQALLPENYKDQIQHVLETSNKSNNVIQYKYQAATLRCKLHVIRELNLCHWHIQDISETVEAEQRLTFLAYHDSLTRLPNRAKFESQLRQTLEHHRGEPVIVGLLALDRFQLITASHGYTTGDLLIRAFSQRAQQWIMGLQSKGIKAQLFRFNGSTFAVMLHQNTLRYDVKQITQDLDKLLAEPFNASNHSFTLTVSQGYACAPEHGHTASDLIRNADAAITHVINHNGNDVCIYSDQLRASLQNLLRTESELRDALENQELELHYQPQVAASTGRVNGVEALLRWRKSNGQFVSPGVFIPIAEQTGLILEIGHWVLQQACQQAKLWADKFSSPIVVAINISARQFQSEGFIDSLRQILSQTGADPKLIELELTESLFMDDVEETLKKLQDIRELGVTLAIDDFGTGYSSLSYLKRLPIDKLKIDQSFVKGLPDDKDDLAIIQTTIDLAHNLDLNVIAEGVESQEQYEILQAYGCEEIQGYLISKPTPVPELERFVSNQRLH